MLGPARPILEQTFLKLGTNTAIDNALYKILFWPPETNKENKFMTMCKNHFISGTLVQLNKRHMWV